MANYQESNISGVTWTRCNTVIITNPLPGSPSAEVRPTTKEPYPPSATFKEEQIMSIDNKIYVTGNSICAKDFEPTSLIPLLDPNTNQPTGTSVTHAELYQILYSLYIQTAMERDVVMQSTP